MEDYRHRSILIVMIIIVCCFIVISFNLRLSELSELKYENMQMKYKLRLCKGNVLKKTKS
jgi:hypothetical protein